MHHAAHVVLVDDALDGAEVGHVGPHADQRGGLLLGQRDRQAVPVVPGVEGDDLVPALEEAAGRPDADGAQRSSYEDAAQAPEATPVSRRTAR
jgi:hypothetical protein